jgi:hypothetical protein
MFWRYQMIWKNKKDLKVIWFNLVLIFQCYQKFGKKQFFWTSKQFFDALPRCFISLVLVLHNWLCISLNLGVESYRIKTLRSVPICSQFSHCHWISGSGIPEKNPTWIFEDGQTFDFFPSSVSRWTSLRGIYRIWKGSNLFIPNQSYLRFEKID